jgi:hypothetical protein
MRSRNGKGAKVLQGIAATGKIPQPADKRKRKGAKARGQEFATLKICLQDKKNIKVSR